jgi:hypothetical protein
VPASWWSVLPVPQAASALFVVMRLFLSHGL